MPQLDLYMFTYQLHVFGGFYFLIYVYLRGIVIPNLSTIIKYRKKLGQYLSVKDVYFFNFFEKFKSLAENKINTCCLVFFKNINKNVQLNKHLFKIWNIFSYGRYLNKI